LAALENLNDNGDIYSASKLLVLERISKFRPKRVSGFVNKSLVKHGLVRNVKNWLNEERGLNYSGYRTQVKGMKII
jgi:hypothetical protein